MSEIGSCSFAGVKCDWCWSENGQG